MHYIEQMKSLKKNNYTYKMIYIIIGHGVKIYFH